jgi:hypothetical protein
MTPKNSATVELGHRGRKARTLTQEERREVARKAEQARWAKLRELKKEISEGNRTLLRASKANARKAREIEV